MTAKALKRGPAQLFGGAPLLAALLSASCATTAPYLEQGLALEAQGQYEEALSVYQAAIAKGTATPDKLRPRISAVTDGMAGQRAATGMTALERGQLEEAVVALTEADALSPENLEVQALRNKIADTLVASAADRLTDGQPASAIALLDRAIVLAPTHASAISSREEIVERFTLDLESAIRRYEQTQLPGNALVASVVLASLHPESIELEEDARARLQRFFAAAQVPVSIEVEGDSSLNESLKRSLASPSFKSPFMTLRPGVSSSQGLVLETDKLSDRISISVQPGMGLRSVPKGTRKVPNPEVKDLGDELAKTMTQITSLEESIDAIHTQISLLRDPAEQNRLRGRVTQLEREHHVLSTHYVELEEKQQQLPPEVEVTNYQEIQVPIETHTRTLELSASLHGLCRRSDFPVDVTYEFAAQASAKGETHRAYPDYGLEAKSLLFDKSDAALREEAIPLLADRIIQTADAVMNDLLVIELRKGRSLAKQGELEAALEHLVRVVMGTSTPVPEDVAQFLALRGLTDPERLRLKSPPMPPSR